jgi:hypothetical protein
MLHALSLLPPLQYYLKTHHFYSGGELQEAREALARADSSSSDSEDESGSKKKKDQDKPTEEVIDTNCLSCIEV